MTLLRRRLQGLFGRSFQLEVRSEIGEGTTVTMRIPLRKQLGVGFESPGAITPDLRNGASLRSVLMWRIRAVINEDEPLAVEYLAALLDDTYQVEVVGAAAESESGLRLCAELRPIRALLI